MLGRITRCVFFRHAVEESWLVHTRDTRVVRQTDHGLSALRLRLRLHLSDTVLPATKEER